MAQSLRNGHLLPGCNGEMEEDPQCSYSFLEEKAVTDKAKRRETPGDEGEISGERLGARGKCSVKSFTICGQ